MVNTVGVPVCLVEDCMEFKVYFQPSIDPTMPIHDGGFVCFQSQSHIALVAAVHNIIEDLRAKEVDDTKICTSSIGVHQLESGGIVDEKAYWYCMQRSFRTLILASSSMVDVIFI